MENEQRHYGLRSGSRSRSQTPLVQNRALVESEILEHHYDLRSRSKERSRTPGEVPNTRRSVSKMSLGNNSKMNDQNMETITERRKDTVTVDSLSEGETKKIEDFSAGIKRVERRSERQKAKKQIFSNGQTDTKEHSSGRTNEESRKSISPRRIITSDYSSEEEITNRPNSAHEIYKQAGDWWNVFPKTDYTYSERSQCRYEIAPGILAMPNMSRRSIHSDASGTFESMKIEKEGEANADICTSVDDVHGSCTLNADGKSKIQYRKTHVEQYRCHRETIYTVPKSSMNSQTSRSSGSDSQSKCIHSRKYDVTSCADSDTELDEAISSKSTRETEIRGRLRNLVSVIVLWFSKLLEFLKLRAVKRRVYHTPYEYQRYESRWYKMWRLIDRCLQYVYLFMVKIFFFDSWLLSRVCRIRSWMHQRSPKVFWIGLLPLLLLTGAYIVQKQSFVRLDSLHNIVYDVTETSYSILNDIINLTSFQSNSVIEYIKTVKNLSSYLLPRMNVSLPDNEMS